MKTLPIKIREKIAVYDSDEKVVCHNSDYLLKFDFDAEWTEYKYKTAIVRYFKAPEGWLKHEIMFEGETCELPVIDKAAELYIGVFAGDIRTTTEAKIPCRLSALSMTGVPVDPPDNVYNQILKMLEELKAGEVSPEDIKAAVDKYFEDNPIDPADLGAVSADQGVENADRILGIGKDGKVIPVDKPQGDVKTVAGVEPDASGNVPLTASDVGASPGVYYGSDEPSEEYDVWFDPNGNESELLTAESIKTALGYTPADEEAVDSLSEEIDELRKQGGISGIEMRDADPTGEDLTEGRIWILRVGDNTLTIPVIELGNVSDNSITIKLSNTCRDENGDVVTTYNVYVDSALNKTTTIAAGGTCVIDGLSPETEYQISVRGVKDAMVSKMSNTLTATTLEVPDGEQETMILAGYAVLTANNAIGCSVQKYAARAVYVATSGNKEVPPIIDGVQYYLVEVPEDAISCTVSCDGFMWGFNGWNTGSDGKLTYDVDSGWKASGATYTFEAGAAEYVTIGFKKASTGSEAITQEDVAGITVAFA